MPRPLDLSNEGDRTGPEWDLFPEASLSFPRANWKGVIFAWPVFRPGEDVLRLAWAARAASRAWEAALASGDMGALGVPEFALALFDKVDEL